MSSTPVWTRALLERACEHLNAGLTLAATARTLRINVKTMQWAHKSYLTCAQGRYAVKRAPFGRGRPKGTPRTGRSIHEAALAKRCTASSVAEFIALNGVTKCPPRFCAPSEHAVVENVAEKLARIQAEPPPVKNIPEARAWSLAHGYGDIERAARGTYVWEGKLYSPQKLCLRVNSMRLKLLAGWGPLPAPEGNARQGRAG